MNKGRDYYRSMQAKCKRLCQRGFVPTERKKGLFHLSDRAYEKRNVRQKKLTVVNAGGTPVDLHYETCTYVRASNS